MHLDRRRFLAALALTAACGGPAEQAAEEEPAAAPTTFDAPLGAQLYTLRSVLPDNPTATLQALAAIGYQEVEVLQAGYDELAPLVLDAGLKPKSMHLRPGVITGVWGANEERPPQSEVAAAMADNLLGRDDLNDSSRVRLAYERALTRPPSPQEVDQALSFIAEVDKALADREPKADERKARAWQSFCKALIGSNEFLYLN